MTIKDVMHGPAWTATAFGIITILDCVVVLVLACFLLQHRIILALFMDYYRSIGENRFLIETWSGNRRMLGCARKLGFKEVKRIKGAHMVDGIEYDALIWERRFEFGYSKAF